MHPLTFTLVWLLPEAMTRGQYLAPDTRAALFTGRRFGAVEVRRIRAVLLVAQVAVTAALLYVCALTVHSFAAVSAVELGFYEDRIVGLQMPAPVRQFSGPREERRTRFERQVQLAFDTRDAIRALPGVAGAAFGPVGQRVQGPRRTWRIAAVVSDVASERPDRPVAAEVLVLTAEPRAQLVVRLAEDANTHVARAAIAATFERVWPEKASRDVVPVAALVAVARADYMSRALVLTIIGILCVPLAVAGVAGAAAFSVQRRAREIAIRLALGASHLAIRPAVVHEAALIVGLDVAAGVGGGVLLGRVIGSHLFGIHPADPLRVAAAAGALFVVAAAGAWFPARRAAAIDPADVLKAV